MEPSSSATYSLRRLHHLGLELPQLLHKQGLAPFVRHSSPTEFNPITDDMLWFEYSLPPALSPNSHCHLPQPLAWNTQHPFVNCVSSKAPPSVLRPCACHTSMAFVGLPHLSRRRTLTSTCLRSEALLHFRPSHFTKV